MKKKIILTLVCVLVAFISFFPVANYFSSTTTHMENIEYLSEKQHQVLGLSAGATAASALVSLAPGDACSAIADKLADLTMYFMVILCAIFLEKYMLTITGLAVFKCLIPIACLIFVLYIWKEDVSIRRLGINLSVFSLCLFLLIPTSLAISKTIEATHQDAIETTLEKVENYESEGEQNALQKFFATTTNALKEGKEILNDYVESIAVFIVTTCVIPVLIMLVFVYVTKMFVNASITGPMLPSWVDVPRLKSHSD